MDGLVQICLALKHVLLVRWNEPECIAGLPLFHWITHWLMQLCNCLAISPQWADRCWNCFLFFMLFHTLNKRIWRNNHCMAVYKHEPDPYANFRNVGELIWKAQTCIIAIFYQDCWWNCVGERDLQKKYINLRTSGCCIWVELSVWFTFLPLFTVFKMYVLMLHIMFYNHH